MAALSAVLCPAIHTETWQEQSCWQQDWGKLLQALVKSRFWLDLCFLMRWLSPDLCQVSVPLLAPAGSCWHPVNRPGPLWVPNWPWHENNDVLCFCMMGTFPQKVMKPVITYPAVIALWWIYSPVFLKKCSGHKEKGVWKLWKLVQQQLSSVKIPLILFKINTLWKQGFFKCVFKDDTWVFNMNEI